MESAKSPTVAAHEQTLIELTQWLAKVQQYSARHPVCAQLGERTHRALARSLALAAPVAFGVTKDRILCGETALAHPAIASRLAPHLYERAVLVLRFIGGASVAELTTLIEILSLPVQTTFDRGGIAELARARGLTRIQIEEFQHDISADEREAQKRRARLRAFLSEALRNILAGRAAPGLGGEELLELLDHPDIAVTILEEDPAGVVDAFAGLCLMTYEEEKRTGLSLRPKLRAILLMLGARSLDRILLGFASLVGEFREAVAWLFEELGEHDVARLAFASLRAHPREADVVFYALGAAFPHDGFRLSAVRRVGRLFYDLPHDDASGTELVEACAVPVDAFDSYACERDALLPHAVRARAMRSLLPEGMMATKISDMPIAEFDGRRTMNELVAMASRTRRFEQLCAKLPAASAQLARAGATESVVGILRALLAVQRVDYKELANKTLRDVVTPGVAEQLLVDLDAASAEVEGAALEDVTATVRLVAGLCPEAVLDRLETSESRKMRRVILDALSSVGAAILPHVRGKLRSESWFVVRNAVVLLPRVGGTTSDLASVARHPNEKVRVEVVRGLRAMAPDATMMDVVAQYISDKVPEIRRAALPMLRGELLGPSAIEQLEKVALDEHQPEDVRRRVVEALGRAPLDAAATALFTLLQPRGLIEIGSLRDVVAMALRRSPAPLAPGYFAEGLRSPAWRVRKACERAAGGGS